MSGPAFAYSYFYPFESVLGKIDELSGGQAVHEFASGLRFATFQEQ
ncbi:MAG: hypothetical protein VXZ82_25760 [Planctomycetota bacterium]|nr:hypothetical protein [Planctomycetota bacterium]